MNFFNDWISYKNNKIVINDYDCNLHIGNSFEDTLVSQAKIIYDNFKNLNVFVSGGIDSQTIAYAFKKSKLPVNYYFIKMNYNDSYNKTEYFFASEFCKKYDINLKILEYNFNKDDIIELLLKENFYEKETGVGVLFQTYCMNDFLNKTDGVIINGYGVFLYKRDYNICKGLIPSLYSGHAYGCDIPNSISFYYYSPLIFKHYEHFHRTDKTLQYPVRFQPKNLVFTKLGFFLRPKLKGCEHMDFSDSYSKLTTINYGQDGNVFINRSSQKILIDELFGKDANFNKYLKNKTENTIYTTLYEFETDVFKYD